MAVTFSLGQDKPHPTIRLKQIENSVHGLRFLACSNPTPLSLSLSLIKDLSVALTIISARRDHTVDDVKVQIQQLPYIVSIFN